MNMTISLFQIEPFAFLALAVNRDDQTQIWKCRFSSLEELVLSLTKAGALSTEEMETAKAGTWFKEGVPIIRMWLDRERLENAGFVCP